MNHKSLFAFLCGCAVCGEEKGRVHTVRVGEYSGVAVLGRDLVITIPFDGCEVAEFVLRQYRAMVNKKSVKRLKKKAPGKVVVETPVRIGSYGGFAKVVGTDIIVSIPFN